MLKTPIRMAGYKETKESFINLRLKELPCYWFMIINHLITMFFALPAAFNIVEEKKG